MSIIDDGDSKVQYSGGGDWQADGFQQATDGTRHGTLRGDATASCSFSGTGIDVFGILSSGNPQAQVLWTATVDGNPAGSYTVPNNPPNELNVKLFSISGLDSGSHNIVLTNVNPYNQIVLWLDYFSVTSASPAPPAQPTTTTLPSQTSSSSFTQASATTIAPNQSSSSTQTSKSSSPQSPNTSSTDNSADPSSSSSSSNPSGSTASSSNSNSSDATSTVTTNGAGSTSSSTSDAGGSSAGNSTPFAVSAPTGNIVQPSASSIVGVSGTSGQQSHTNVAAIVGGIVGALFLLALLALVLLYRRRARRRKDPQFIDAVQARMDDDRSSMATVASLIGWNPEKFSMPASQTDSARSSVLPAFAQHSAQSSFSLAAGAMSPGRDTDDVSSMQLPSPAGQSPLRHSEPRYLFPYFDEGSQTAVFVTPREADEVDGDGEGEGVGQGPLSPNRRPPSSDSAWDGQHAV